MKKKSKSIVIVITIAIIIMAFVHIRINTTYGFRLPGLTFELWEGTCVNDEYDGIVHPTFDDEAYINYCYTDAQMGDEMISVFLYNPLNLYCDDILVRFDYNTRTHNHFWWISEL